MNNDQIFKIIESKVKMKGDTELNFYLNKVKKEMQDLRQENQKLRQEQQNKR